MTRLLSVALAFLLAGPALAQQNLDKLGERAAKLKPAPPRYIENYRFGVRGVTFKHIAISPSNAKTLYATSYNGFVYASHDGGQSWQEGRLITERVKFFGAIRPTSTPNLTKAQFKWQGLLTGVWKIPFSTNDYLDRTEVGGVRIGPGTAGLNLGGPVGESPGAGELAHDNLGLSGGGDSSRFGIGIVRAAPRLQALMAKRQLRLIGLNLKLLLNIKGLEPTWVNHVAIHPTNPKIAVVATAMGLFRTTDGGLGWIDIFNGRSYLERFCHFVAFDPSDPDKIWLGTGQGLLYSPDGGDRFLRVTGTQLSSLLAHWVAFYPKNPKIMYAGSNNGAFRSDDGGINWKWIFFETLPTQNFIMSIAVDPNDPDRVQLATKDGIFKSSDGGKSWSRSGGFLFTSQWVWRLIADPADSNHLIANTYLQVWETFDWGKTWSAMYINDSDWSPRMIVFDSKEKDTFWIATSAELLKVSPKPPPQPDPVRWAALREQLKREPRLTDAMDAAFRVHASHMGELGALRARARWSSLVPELHAWAGFVAVDTNGATNSAEFGSFAVPGGIGGGGFDSGLLFTHAGRYQLPYFGAWLTWDLSHLLFHIEEAPYGRYFNDANMTYLKLKVEVQRLYEERRRVLVQTVTVPPNDVRALMNLRLRLEELTAHLNQLTGGLYDTQTRGLERLPLVQ